MKAAPVAIASFLTMAGAAISTSASASIEDYVSKLCSRGCNSVAAEMVATQSVWSALQAMGSTQYIGSQVNGKVLDQSALIAGARSMGASEFDQFLRTGRAPGGDSSVVLAAQARMDSVRGTDVSDVTMRTSAIASAYSTGGPTYSTTSSGGGQTDGVYCASDVAQMQVAAAQARIEQQVELAKSDVGYSTLGGGGIDNPGSDGFSSLSCLERLMNSGGDIFFSPPNLKDLTSSLENFACNKANAVFRDVTAPLNQGIYETVDLGGFYPGLSAARLGGGINVRVRPGMGSVGQIDMRGLPGSSGKITVPGGKSLGDLYR